MEDRKFVDISYIIDKQYAKFSNWAELVTVHGSVTETAISNMSGVLLVATMSNNNYNLTEQSLTVAKANPNSVVGFITQERIKHKDLVCMTPGIALANMQINDQRYKKPQDVDTDYIIVGRALYNSENIENEIKKYL